MTPVLLLLALSQTVDHTDVVRAAKAAAIAAGVNVDADECARFEVTKRVAVLLASEGAGLLDKPTGNNCQGFAVDVIAYPNGQLVDILGSGPEGPNSPHWMGLAPVDPSRYRPVPGEATPPAPPAPAPEPPATVEDHDAALHRMEAQLEQVRADIQKLRELEAEDTEALHQHIDHVVKQAEQSVSEGAPLIVKILSLGFVK